MIKNGDLPAMPSGVLQDGHNCGEYPLHVGLSKREQFAMAAMQGLLGANIDWDGSGFTDIAADAAVLADTLLAELERTK